MSLSKNYRWVLVNSLLVRNEARVPAHVPTYTFAEIEEVLQSLFTADATDYLYHKDTRKMKIREIQDVNGDYLCMLVSAGDKNVPDVMYENFTDSAIRSIEKEEDEGAVVTSHILIKKEREANGGHLMLIERVPGINISQVERYLNFLFKQGATKTFEREDEDVEYRPLFEIVGYQSNTLREALVNNTLQDIEFVKHNVHEDDGIDEHGYVQEEVTRAKLVVKRGIETDTEDTFIQDVVNKFRQGNYEEMYVRIKTRNNQIKTIEVDTEREDILSQYFICNEFINEFDEPLENACLEIRADMVQKLRETAGEYED
ncbi:MAG: hypothetical protein KDJ75_03970 [Alphaproteobacteria bacterium]|nr:hypothetical protein [Alphaproteobacteria bacterium]